MTLRCFADVLLILKLCISFETQEKEGKREGKRDCGGQRRERRCIYVIVR